MEQRHARLIAELQQDIERAATETFVGRMKYVVRMDLPPNPRMLRYVDDPPVGGPPLTGDEQRDAAIRAQKERERERMRQLLLDRATNRRQSVVEVVVYVGTGDRVRIEEHWRGAGGPAGHREWVVYTPEGVWEYYPGSSSIAHADGFPLDAPIDSRADKGFSWHIQQNVRERTADVEEILGARLRRKAGVPTVRRILAETNDRVEAELEFAGGGACEASFERFGSRWVARRVVGEDFEEHRDGYHDFGGLVLACNIEWRTRPAGGDASAFASWTYDVLTVEATPDLPETLFEMPTVDPVANEPIFETRRIRDGYEEVRLSTGEEFRIER